MKIARLDTIDRFILAGLVAGTLGFLFTWWPLAFLFIAAVCFSLAAIEGRLVRRPPQ